MPDADSSNVVTDPRPDPTTDVVTEDAAKEVYRPSDPVDQREWEQFQAWKASQGSQPEPPPSEALTSEVTSSDSGLDSDVRLSALEYRLSLIPPQVFGSRAPFTNPVDDPDDAPMQAGDDPRAMQPGMQHLRTPGNWDDHPWKALADHLRDSQSETSA